MFGLIRFIIHTALLPFRIVFGLILIPFHILTHNFFLFAVIFGIVVLYAMFHSHQSNQVSNDLPKAPPTLTVAPQLAPATGASNQPPPRVDPILKHENGDSEFASDLYTAMNDQERAYYSQLFYWAMGTLKDKQPYPWAQNNINGTIMPLESFDNKMGQRCRTFREVLKVHTVEQHLSGIACEDQGATWCKLKGNATPMCGLGHQAGPFDNIGQSLRNLF